MSLIFPELVSGRHDDEPRAWTIHEGSTMRGEASCNLQERILEVPLTSSEQARVVRAHELMHARVSPRADYLVRSLDEVSARALECAEPGGVFGWPCSGFLRHNNFLRGH